MLRFIARQIEVFKATVDELADAVRDPDAAPRGGPALQDALALR